MSSYTKNNHIPTLRFPGFVGEWEEKTISDIAYVLQGFGFPDKYQGQTTGDLPFCKVGDISAAVDKGGKNYLTCSKLCQLFLASHTSRETNTRRSNDICQDWRSNPF